MRFSLRGFLVPALVRSTMVAATTVAAVGAFSSFASCTSSPSAAGVTYDYFDDTGRHCARACDLNAGTCGLSCDAPKIPVAACPASEAACLSIIYPNDSRLPGVAKVIALQICSTCCGAAGGAGSTDPITDCSAVTCTDDSQCSVEGFVCQRNMGEAKGICTCQGYGCGMPPADGGGGSTTTGTTGGGDGGRADGGSTGTSDGGATGSSGDAATGGSDGARGDAAEASTSDAPAGDATTSSEAGQGGDGATGSDASAPQDGSVEGAVLPDAGQLVDAATEAASGG